MRFPKAVSIRTLHLPCGIPALALLLFVLAASAPRAAVAQMLPPAGGQAMTSYRLGPKDQIAIKVYEVPELNVEVRVAENGKVNLPLIGEVPAEGLTEAGFAQQLKALLEAKYVNRATVSVEVREARSRPILVVGAVRTPGNLAFPGRWTLIEALAAAGGLSAEHADTLYVLRRAENGLSDQVAIRIEDLFVRGDPRANIPIFANDLINVPVTVEVTVFCLGEVLTPGAIQFKSTDRITVLSVIARAGGLTDRASKKMAIKRRKGESLQEEVEVDYKKILAGKEPDLSLADGDVLVIKESLL
ncbi:MAG: polysaccharide biosynthesis/export family protein [Thermoanaerobaculia bacterium]